MAGEWDVVNAIVHGTIHHVEMDFVTGRLEWSPFPQLNPQEFFERLKEENENLIITEEMEQTLRDYLLVGFILM